jgi:transcriptional/translational regulatory protein YebC/TACO1
MGRAFEVRKSSMEKTSVEKSKIYSRFGREIYQAAKNGSTEIKSNPQLKSLIEKAKKNFKFQIVSLIRP